jgi:hypothetical protein
MKKIIKQKNYFEKICSPDNLHLNFSESHKKYLGSGFGGINNASRFIF